MNATGRQGAQVKGLFRLFRVAPTLGQCFASKNRHAQHNGTSSRRGKLAEHAIQEPLILAILLELPFPGLHDLLNDEFLLLPGQVILFELTLKYRPDFPVALVNISWLRWL